GACGAHRCIERADRYRNKPGHDSRRRIVAIRNALKYSETRVPHGSQRFTMTDITRRDFLDGIALTIAAGLTPAAQGPAEPARYPPALDGLGGQHDGSFEVAYLSARQGAAFQFDSVPPEERYDLVVVGGGISGLAAAFFYRRAAGPAVRILILDNHDDFGG